MSANLSLFRKVHAELDALTARGLLTAPQAAALKERYPVAPWDFKSLARTFTSMGALTAVTGFLILVKDKLDWWLVSETALAAAAAGLLLGGLKLKRSRPLPLLGESLELSGAAALQGLTMVLAAHYSSGGKNWPDLVGLDSALLLALAYAQCNRFTLWYALANFFFCFGASTGYMSGWGAYYLGMSYPVRFLAVGLVTLGLAWLHALKLRGRWAPFSRVYAHYGLLVTNLALWFLSLFGYFSEGHVRWSGTGTERLLFSLLWALTAGASLLAGAKYGLRLLRGYGLTFLIINVYTFYFQFVVVNTLPALTLHLLLLGGGTIWLGLALEKSRAAKPPETAAAAKD